ncbi:MAG: hypothetical protein IJ757_09310 [Clostridiales bacterium]|nr:hypothetical protein [Clostridiales bacterium]
MAQEEFNIKEKPRDERFKKAAVYTICSMVLVLTVLLDIYFLTDILA